MTTIAPTASEPKYYRLRLGKSALERGERVVCEWLGWAGANQAYAHVRIVHSNVASYRRGKKGMIAREQLIPLRRAEP